MNNCIAYVTRFWQFSILLLNQDRVDLAFSARAIGNTGFTKRCFDNRAFHEAILARQERVLWRCFYVNNFRRLSFGAASYIYCFSSQENSRVDA